MGVFKGFLIKIKQLISHEGVKRYTTNTSWLFSEQALRIVINLFIGIYVARYLGPEQFGVLSYALAFSGIFSAFSRLGVDDVLVKEQVNRPDRKLRLLGTAYWMRIASGIFSLGTIAFILPFTDNSLTVNVYIMIIAAGITFESLGVIESHFHSIVEARYISICKILQLSISGVLKLYFIFTEADLVFFVIVHLIDAITLAIALLAAYRIQGYPPFFKFFNKSYAWSLIKSSWPIMISSGIVMIFFRIDQVIIIALLGEQENGLYSSAVKITEAYFLIPTIITTSLFPAILNAKKIGEKVYYERLQYLYDFLIWMSIAVSVIISLTANWLMPFLFGVEYADAGTILAIKIWIGIFVAFGSAWSKWMYTENQFKMTAVFQTFAMVLNIILNFALIPVFGVEGAAIASLIAASAGHIVLPAFIPSQRIAFVMMIKSLNLFKYVSLLKSNTDDR